MGTSLRFVCSRVSPWTVTDSQTGQIETFSSRDKMRAWASYHNGLVKPQDVPATAPTLEETTNNKMKELGEALSNLPNSTNKFQIGNEVVIVYLKKPTAATIRSVFLNRGNNGEPLYFLALKSGRLVQRSESDIATGEEVKAAIESVVLSHATI